MIEMLGVLALIGVLTIGGVWGYKLAISRYWAGRILNDVKQYHVVIEGMDAPFDTNGIVRDNDFTPETVYGFVAERPSDSEGKYYRISVVDVPANICRAMVTMAGKNPYDNYVSGEAEGASKIAVQATGSSSFDWSNGENESICSGEENEVIFFFGAIEGICRTECDGDEKCYYGTCCLTKNQCNGNCCGEGQVCCNGSCHLQNCGTDGNGKALEMNESCGCQCPTGLGYNAQMTNGNCTCNTANGFTEQNGQCVCPSGKVNVNGKCMSFGCYTAANRSVSCTSQNTCHCFLDDKRCGHDCTAEGGNTCRYGLCMNMCSSGKWEYNTGASDYGCTTADGLFQCAYWNGTAATSIACVEKNKGYEYFCGKSCLLDGTGCQYGDCTDVCSSNTYGTTPNNGVRGSFERIGAFWGCKYEGEDWTVSCVKQGYVNGVGYVYYCYKNGEVCAQYCKNPYPDSTCSNNTCGGGSCPTDPTASELNTPMTSGDDGRCTRKDGVYCKLGWDNSGYWCYLSNNELCGKNCNLDGTNCQYGCCDGGDGSSCCSSGYSYQKISNYYGCYKDGIGCYNGNAAKTSYICELNGIRCAEGCNSTGTSCNYGSCDPTSCDKNGRNLTFQQITTNYFGCYDNDTGLGCYKYSSDTRYRCYKGTTECSNNCGPNYDGKQYNSTAVCGTCTTTAFACPTGTQLLSSVTKETAKGCVNPNGITCLENGTCYASYGAYPNAYRCGTGCQLDGSCCKGTGTNAKCGDTGVCDPDECNGSWVYNTSKDLYECQDNGGLTCSGGICKLGDKQCGVECHKGENGDLCHDGTTTCTTGDVVCNAGVCQVGLCTDGLTSIKRATDDFYGCYNSTKNTTCYPYNESIYCMQNGRMIGTDCELDGTNCTCTAGTGKEVREPGLATTNVNTSAVCSWCPKGSCSSVDGKNCIGSSTAFTKTQVCMKCPEGKYVIYSGYTSCSTATAGNYTVGTGNVAQTQCPTGTTTTGQGYYCSSIGCTTDSAECNQACAAAANVEDCKKGVPACGCRSTSNTCTKNADCDDGYFCWFANNTNCYSSGTGECKKVSDFTPTPASAATITAAGKTWVRSTTMNWWSAQNWCKAQGKKPVSRADLGCGDNLSGTYCTQSGTVLKAIQDTAWKSYGAHWLEDYGNSCFAYYVLFSNSYVSHNYRYASGRFALCQ